MNASVEGSGFGSAKTAATKGNGTANEAPLRAGSLYHRPRGRFAKCAVRRTTLE